MVDRTCLWNDDVAMRIVHNKKAIGAALFISFLGYTAAVILAETQRGKRVSRKY